MLTQSRLKEVVEYDPDTGIFVRKEHTRRVVAGSTVGTKRSNGYLAMRIDNELYYLHRLVFLYMLGALPTDNVDHVNGNKTDNRFTNLREATVSQNAMNRSKQSNNTSGYKGVTWDRAKNKWKAQIKSRFIGYYNTAEEASRSYTIEAMRVFGEYNHNQ